MKNLITPFIFQHMRKAIYNFSMKYFISLLFASSCIAGQVPLFQNDSLENWHIVGPQITFTLENDVLTGEGKELQNSFLTSKKSYSDFYLKVDVIKLQLHHIQSLCQLTEKIYC